MRKIKVLLTTAVIMAAVSMWGCGKENTDNETTTTGGPVETTTPEETTTEEPTSEATTTSNYSGDYSEYSTELVEYGVGSRRLEDGRYEGAIYCQNKYSDYQVEFIKENDKVIYLTFDEGYENGYTGAILDVLKEKNVKAVFFVTMDWVKAEPDLLKRIIDEGHVVGSHSVTHQSMPTLSIEKQKEEYTGLHNYIRDNYGYEMYLFRPPMGHFSEQSLAVAADMGYTSVLWSFAHVDWLVDKQPSHEEALQTTVERLHNGAIYLLHAVSEANTAVLGDFIDQARALGYEFKEYTRDSIGSYNTTN
ncbi:MAG: polysaccharide deacetylase family protein [Lachnospiraceae bacterium]|nr:polysaccharide deacetylase family protein [Lachnospiraceae bacterium]